MAGQHDLGVEGAGARCREPPYRQDYKQELYWGEMKQKVQGEEGKESDLLEYRLSLSHLRQNDQG